jgi:ribonuclease R
MFIASNEEKYTFRLFLKLQISVVVNQWFGRTVINSIQRFAYEAQYIIETKDNTQKISIQEVLMCVSDEIVAATLKMDELAKIFRRKR